jgi:DNA invertase Pin-like site-specific DNA recombinase
MGKCFFHIIAAISEMERDLIKERTIAGLEAARRMGRVGGRHRALNANQIKHAQELVAQGKSKVEIAKLLNVGRATLYRLLEDDAA